MELLILNYCILQMTTLLDFQTQIGLEIMMTENQHIDSFYHEWCCNQLE